MDYARAQRNPSRHLLGLSTVIVLHILVVWALVSGLARKVVEVVKGPIEVKVIEEIAPPPPPQDLLPPPPKLAAPPPPFIPPPEVNIAQPLAPTITAVSREAPPTAQSLVIAKPVEAPPAPRIQSAQVACPNYREVMGGLVYPRQALLDGTEGEVVIEFTVGPDGAIRDVQIRSSTNRVFNRPSLQAVSALKCNGQGRDIRVQAPLSFKIN